MGNFLHQPHQNDEDNEITFDYQLTEVVIIKYLGDTPVYYIYPSNGDHAFCDVV